MLHLGLNKKVFVVFTMFLAFNGYTQVQYVVSNVKSNNTYISIYDALEAASKSIKKKGYPAVGIEIIIKDGYYKIDKTIGIDKSLSGKANTPLVIKAENAGKVHLFGGEILDFKKFSKFKPSKAPFKLNDASVGSKLIVLDLEKEGVKKKDLGEFVKHGYGFERNPNFTTPAMLWVEGERMHLSRWPNVDEKNEYYDNVNQFKGRFKDVEITGAVSLLEVLDMGKKKANMWFNNSNFLQDGGGTFSVAFNRGDSWDYYKTAKEKIWLDGVLSASWEWEYTQVKSIEDKKITMASGSNRGLGFFRKVTHFHFENVPEELDSPGEYFIDRENMLLYFYPPENIENKTITLSTLEDNMIELEGASHVKIEGLVLESGRGNAINVINEQQWKKVLTQSTHVTIENCTIRNFNQWGVLVQGPHNSLVNNCHIYNLGAGGVKLGSDLKSFSLVKENNVVSNTEIHHIAFDQKSQIPGITIAGCANTARNNEIYNTPHFAIKMKFANDCIAENNYMHDLPEYHHFDGGALYLATGGQFYNRGNKIKNNYFENINTNGAYLDNYTMGNTVFGNVFFNVGNSTKGSKNGAVYVHGGGQNIIENNIAIDCPYAYKTGSHIVKASNTTNYLSLWYEDAFEHFRPNTELYNKYVKHYPELKDFLFKLHHSPNVIRDHVKNNTIKAISSPKNKKKQIDVYDLNGVKAHLGKDLANKEWENWYKLRYQSTTFKNNAYCFTSNAYVPDFENEAKGAKGAFKLGGETGVFEMSPYNLKENGRTKKYTNHIFIGNKWVKSPLKELGVLSNTSNFKLSRILKINAIPEFKEINSEIMGIEN